MSINKKIIIAALAGMVFGVSSCKKFLNVNTNPNGAQTATVQTLLPAAELYVGTSVGVDLEIDGSFFAQYWTQSPGASQYHAFDQYSPGQDGFSTPWTNLYAAAENFYQLYKLADSEKKTQYMAISLLMQAYTFQLITDAWGDVPCAQALKGQYADGHLVNPTYDAQMQVYDTIISYISQANVLLANPNPNFPPGPDDLIYGGTMGNWQAFSNTLALKVYMRLSQINPTVAQDSVAALYARNSAFIASGQGQDAFIAYGSSSANENPLFAEAIGLEDVQNLVGSAFCLDTMLNDGDPRMNIFYTPGQNSGGALIGLQQGKYDTSYYEWAYPSIFVGGDAQNFGVNEGFYASGSSGNAPVNFITSYESLFLQAEAVARGWAPATVSDNDLFYQAIQANFNYYNNAFEALVTDSAIGVWPESGAQAYASYIASPTAIWAQYPASGSSVAQRVQYIITQKYFAMCGNQGFEAWSEWRRTGYPAGMKPSVSSIIGGGLFPQRFTYPSSESTVNASFPGLQPITAKVWWQGI